MKSWSAGEKVNASDLNQNFIDVVPCGVILPWPTDTPPSNYLICDGATISKTTYAALFALIGHAYGADPGGGNFILPNLKGKIPVGKNSAETEFDALGETGGEKTHTLTTAELAAHTHAYTHAGIGSGDSEYSVTNTPGVVGSTGSAGSGNAHNNLQPYIVLNYIIKI